MSRGPGRIEREIAAILDAAPDNAFSVPELCQQIYKATEKKHRVAVICAGRTIARRGANIDWCISRRRGGKLVFFTPDNVMSRGMAGAKAGNFPGTDDQLRARLIDPNDIGKRIQPGGWNWIETELFIAERAGDQSRIAEMKTAAAALDARLRRMFPEFMR
jgi:hypothetical protein